MKTEGIFRVNGSAKAIANLRTQFDITAADNLDGSSQNDIHAICGVFKLFLREIPEGIIPDSATKRIVKGLRQQSLSNLATTYFITHFDVIFSDEVPGVESIDGSQAHLISATSLNSLLQRQKKRRLPPRRSVIGMEMPRSRPITPRGDVLSPVVSPVLGAGVSAHSTSSLSLSPVHKWMYSDNEDMDLGSHGVLARELATIMTSISIPSVASAEKFSPSNPPICTRPVAERPNATPPPPQSLAGVDLAKSLPSLIHPSEACGAWRGRRRRSPGNAADEDAEEAMEEEEESSESSANSLLEGPLDTSGYLHKHFHHDALPHLLTESNTETTQTLTLDDDFDSVCQSCLSSVSWSCIRLVRVDL
ncbi:unnamed protein product [Mesocestoides corti]|uniref:Rho-GAP domain-containing protein n=1 Tax=Mesocestoides corti TaxID=53468 RepID=A0A0R3U9Y6_MESCO|nr:unnamed protein product [Mesocestoides corti]